MKWLRRALLALLIPLSSLAATEATLRLIGYGVATDFLVRRSTPSGDVWVDNPRFTDRFFPRSMERRPVAICAAAQKPANEYRVVVLGSSAAMGDPDPTYGFGQILGLMLADRMPDSSVRVINTGMVAVNSFVVREVASELDKLRPDAVVVYEGNNEVVGPFGPSSLQGSTPPPLPVIRARIALGTLRVGQLMEDLVGRALRRPEPGEWRGMKLFLGRDLDATDPRIERVHDAFRANMEDILASVARTGARGVVVPSPVNLRGCAPFEGADADADYRAAQRLWAGGRRGEARTLFERACDRDRLRFRADSRLRAIPAELARTAPGLIELADVSAFDDAGSDLFFDHVHMNFAGNFLLARSVFRALTGADAASTETECARRLALTPWERWRVLGEMKVRLSVAPFTGRSDHAEVMARLESEIARLAPDTSASARLRWIAEYDSALAARPHDAQLRWRFSAFLEQLGDHRRAADELAPVIALRPFNAGIRHDRAVALANSGRWEDAERVLRDALEIDPLAPDLRSMLADVLVRRGARADAIAEYRRDIELNPGLTEARNSLAWMLATSADESDRDPAEAVRLASEAARLSAFDDPKILDTLAAAYASAGDFARAVETERRAIELMSARGADAVPLEVRERLERYRSGRAYRE